MKTTIKFETEEFNKAMKKFIRKSNLSTEVVIRKIAFDLLAMILTGLPTAARKKKGNMTGGFTIPDTSAITGRHPVLTGRARAGWYASVKGLGANFNFDSNIDRGNNDVATGKREGYFNNNLKSPWNKWVELINAVSYIIFLEYGFSQQAPAGMLRVSMRKMRGELPKYLNEAFVDDWKKFNF